VLSIASAGEFNLSSSRFTGVDELRFSAHGATVELSQNQDREFATLTGGSGTDTLVMRGDDIDLRNLAILSWSSSDSIELHAEGSLTGLWTIYGSDETDHFFSNVNLGAVQLYGWHGNDVFHLGGSPPGIFTIDGGDGRDVLLATGIGNYDDYSITSMEVFEFGGSSDQSVICSLLVSEGFLTVVGNGFINQLSHNVTANADWSLLTFENWSDNDTVTLTGQESANQITGSQVDDTISGGAGGDTLKGEGGRDVINGESGKDAIEGGKGSDTLFGNKQNDNINGNKGDDVIDGGFGADTMTGGAGADVFDYNGVQDSGLTKNRDLVTDFEVGIDRIDLTTLTITTFRGTNAFSGEPGEVRYSFDGTYTIVSVDIDGDGSDFQFRLSGNIQLELTDFILL
jgi:Ca2+-binding RTX toxin-like protein